MNGATVHLGTGISINSDIAQVLVISTLVSIVVALLLSLSRETLRTISRERNDHVAVQSSHVGDPMRLGGIAVFAGVTVGFALYWQHLSWPMALLFLSAIPALGAGLLEDLGWHVSPRNRLLASAIAAAVAVATLGIWVDRADLPVLDGLMSIAFLSVPLTILASAGFCHAVNLIDGMNGLAGIAIIAASVAIGLLANGHGQTDIAVAAWLLAASGLGFFFLNWPGGRIFLGDAGSYGIGHVLIWLAYALSARAENVVVPALLLILFWPFFDTLHTIVRRLSTGQPVFQPDRMHLHQKVRRALEITWLGRNNRSISNPLTSLFMSPLVIAPVVAGILFSNDPGMAWATLAAFVVMFSVIHRVVFAMATRHRRCFGADNDARLAALGSDMNTDMRNVTDLESREFSPLSAIYDVEGRPVEIQIFRLAEKPWRLRYWDDKSQQVLMTQSFVSDREALIACLSGLGRSDKEEAPVRWHQE